MSTPIYLPIRQGFQVSVGLHALVARISYQVPNGKTAELEAVHMQLRESVASALGAAGMRIDVGTIRLSEIDSLNAIGQRDYWQGYRIFLNSFDVVSISTVNTTGNTLVFTGAFFIREYQ